MINRVKQFMQQPEEERPPADDYFEVHCDIETFYVTRTEAARISSLLARRWLPRWIRFTDIYGAQIQLLARTISSVRESTVAKRQRERDFSRARRREVKEDRHWDVDDDWF